MTASIVPTPFTSFRAPTAPARRHPTARRGAVAGVVGAMIALALAGLVRPTGTSTATETRPVSSAQVLAEMNARLRGAPSDQPTPDVPAAVVVPDAPTTPPVGTAFRP